MEQLSKDLFYERASAHALAALDAATIIHAGLAKASWQGTDSVTINAATI